MTKKFVMLSAVCALGLSVFAGEPLILVSGKTGHGNFEHGSKFGTTGANLSTATKFKWNVNSMEKDWKPQGGKAVASSVAGTGLGQVFVKSNFPANAWAGKTQLTIKFEWATLAAGDSIQVGLAGWNHTGTGVNVFGLGNGKMINSTAHYGKGQAITAQPLVAAGSGANQTGTYTATINLSTLKGVTDLSGFDALSLVFFSNVDGAGGQITLDNVELTCL